MKYLKFIVFLCVLTFTVSCGQQKKYVDYKVKDGETMRMIAKKFDLKTSDLLRLNPDFGRKPGVNSIIVIPNRKMKILGDAITNDALKDSIEKKESIRIEKEELLAALKKDFVVYEIKKGDTFYSLTRFYNVSQEEMIALNPFLLEGLKVGQL